MLHWLFLFKLSQHVMLLTVYIYIPVLLYGECSLRVLLADIDNVKVNNTFMLCHNYVAVVRLVLSSLAYLYMV